MARDRRSAWPVLAGAVRAVHTLTQAAMAGPESSRVPIDRQESAAQRYPVELELYVQPTKNVWSKYRQKQILHLGCDYCKGIVWA
jgi:hypothetical protein